MNKTGKSKFEQLRHEISGIWNQNQGSGVFPSDTEALRLISEIEAGQEALEQKNRDLEQALFLDRENRKKYSELYNSASSAQLSVTREGKIIDLNRMASDLLDLGQGRVELGLFTEFMPMESVPAFNGFLVRIYQFGCIQAIEADIVVNGAFSGYFNISGILSHGGEKCLLTLTDITGHKLSGEAKHSCDSKWHLLVETIPDYIALYNKDGYYDFVYQATKQIRQFSMEVVIIAQTAYGLSGDREKAIEAGCNDYISKPVIRAEIFRLIHDYFPVP